MYVLKFEIMTDLGNKAYKQISIKQTVLVTVQRIKGYQHRYYMQSCP